MWKKTIQQDLKSNNLSLNEATDISTLETDVYIWRYTLLVVHARKQKEDSTSGVCFTCFVLHGSFVFLNDM